MVDTREKKFSCAYLKLMQLIQNTENFEEVRQLIVTWNKSFIQGNTVNARDSKIEIQEVIKVLKDSFYLKNISEKLFAQVEYNPNRFPGSEEFERFISSGDTTQSFFVQTSLFDCNSDGKHKINR